MSKKLVLSAKLYDFTNDRKERISGMKITYINAKPVKANEVGHPPMMMNISDPDISRKINVVPAIYDIDFDEVAGKNNKPQLIVSDADLISEVELSALF